MTLHTAQHTVRFGEVDGANILFFSRIFEICHAAFEEAMAAAGFDLAGIFATADWKMPIVHAEADYVRPMRLGDRLHIAIAPPTMGASSITWDFEIRAEDGALHATARHVHVTIDTAFQSRPVPEAFRAAFPSG